MSTGGVGQLPALVGAVEQRDELLTKAGGVASAPSSMRAAPASARWRAVMRCSSPVGMRGDEHGRLAEGGEFGDGAGAAAGDDDGRGGEHVGQLVVDEVDNAVAVPQPRGQRRAALAASRRG